MFLRRIVQQYFNMLAPLFIVELADNRELQKVHMKPTHEDYIPLMSLCVKTREKWGQVDLMSYVHVSQWGKLILDRN